MYSVTHTWYVVIIYWCRRGLTVFIYAHVSIWARKLGDIEEELYPIYIRMSGRLLSISRDIVHTIVLVNILAVRAITCGCCGLQKLVGVKWEFDGIPF